MYLLLYKSFTVLCLSHKPCLMDNAIQTLYCVKLSLCTHCLLKLEFVKQQIPSVLEWHRAKKYFCLSAKSNGLFWSNKHEFQSVFVYVLEDCASVLVPLQGSQFGTMVGWKSTSTWHQSFCDAAIFGGIESTFWLWRQWGWNSDSIGMLMCAST